MASTIASASGSCSGPQNRRTQLLSVENVFPFWGEEKQTCFFGGGKTSQILFYQKPTAWWMEKESPTLHKIFYLFLLVMHTNIKSSCCTTTRTRLSCPPHCITKWRRVVGFKPQIWASLPTSPAMPPKVPARLGLCSGIINHHDPLMIP